MTLDPHTSSPCVDKVLPTRLAEGDVTYSRPLAATENGFLAQRGDYGEFDFFTLLKIDCSASLIITDDQVTLALTALRLRHPFLASRVSFTSPTPHIVYTYPFNEGHAIGEARAHIEFATFHERDGAAKALHDRWTDVDLARYVIDVRNTLIAAVWFKGVGPATGQYIFGMQNPHLILDGRRQLNLVRQFLELLADPDLAQDELARRFILPPSVVKLPQSLESLAPDIFTCSTDEIEKGKTAFDNVMKWSSKPLSGLCPDGPLQGTKVAPRLLRHTWSQSDTLAILHACKSQGVTITQLILASMAVAAIPSIHSSAEPSAALEDNLSTSDPDDSYYFHVTLPIDLGERLMRPAGSDESALTAAMYPIFIRIPKSIPPNASDMASIWLVARECKEHHKAWIDSPHFWHLNCHYNIYVNRIICDLAAGKPALPSCSNLGDCTKLLPSRYAVASYEKGTDTVAKGPDEEIRIADMVIAGKANALLMLMSMWTFDGKFNLQLRHNTLRMRNALIDTYFAGIIDVVTRAGA